MSRRNRRNTASSMLVVLLVVAFGWGAAAGEGIAREPISILADADLTEANGVVSGSGRANDPYVIAGWAIEADKGIGIRVQGISAHLIIRDCQVSGHRGRGTGILVREAAAVVISNCTFTALGVGVFVYQSPDVSVVDSLFTDCRIGIEGSESDRLSISRNMISRALERGIFLWRCYLALLSENILLDCSIGIYLDSCRHGSVERNRVERADRGIFLWDCFDSTIEGNVIQSCFLGLALVHTSERNIVVGNTFLDNERHATCDEPDNHWDGGYPIGGNYWGEDGLIDQFSGPDQDQPGADGIVDIAREVPFGNIDRYPLASPPAMDEPE